MAGFLLEFFFELQTQPTTGFLVRFLQLRHGAEERAAKSSQEQRKGSVCHIQIQELSCRTLPYKAPINKLRSWAVPSGRNLSFGNLGIKYEITVVLLAKVDKDFGGILIISAECFEAVLQLLFPDFPLLNPLLSFVLQIHSFLALLDLIFPLLSRCPYR